MGSDDESSSSSSSSSSDHRKSSSKGRKVHYKKKRSRKDEDLHRRRRHSKEKKRRHRHLDDESPSENGSDVEDSSHEDRKRRKHHKKKRERTGEKKKFADSSDEEELSHYKSRKRDKKRDKKVKKKEYKSSKARKRKRSERRGDSDSGSDEDIDESLFERNYILADALLDLLEWHPYLAGDLPIMLIRLAGGTSFDLSQMTNISGSRGLGRVLSALQSFGVEKGPDGAWVWKLPGGGSRSGTMRGGNDLVLIKVIRAMLDQIGMTFDAVKDFEEHQAKLDLAEKQKVQTDYSYVSSEAKMPLENAVVSLLQSFDKEQGNLAKELEGLCNMILEGEMVAIDDLPDEKLKLGLERLFALCGLEKSEMEEDDDDEEVEGDVSESERSNKNDDKSKPTMGYCLPDSNGDNTKAKVESILNLCRDGAWKALKVPAQRRPIKGPLLPGQEHDHDSSEDDDVGPAPMGAQRKGPRLPPEMIRAQAEQRAFELELAKSGIDPAQFSPRAASTGAREEWMLVPGKFDFLSTIKSGQPIRNRKFQAKSGSCDPSSQEGSATIMDPQVRAEMDAIMQAHEDARGPSLVELHRQKKAEEAKNAEGRGKQSWKWNRDRDLDAGRRVDKSALNMILGSAASDLKKKFQGGFG